jgi:hypothetical protein
MQCVIREATGVVEFRYGAMPTFVSNQSFGFLGTPAIVGFAYGVHAVQARDPQSRDLSLEVPFTTQVEGAFGNMGQKVVTTPVGGGAVYGGRLFPGQTAKWNVSSVPPGALLGVQLIDIAASRPGFQLPSITAPGCLLSTSPNATLWEVFALPGVSTGVSTVVGTRPLAIPPGFDGADLYAQFVVLDGVLPTGGNLITRSSNAIKHTIGLQ